MSMSMSMDPTVLSITFDIVLTRGRRKCSDTMSPLSDRASPTTRTAPRGDAQSTQAAHQCTLRGPRVVESRKHQQAARAKRYRHSELRPAVLGITTTLAPRTGAGCAAGARRQVELMDMTPSRRRPIWRRLHCVHRGLLAAMPSGSSVGETLTEFLPLPLFCLPE